ncbi:hypothetical protein HNP84_003367 [Thermocatellispora tengchongensis]|uniref:YcaO domain-containing protein n=1 Tax=Thermocatellispora tengchongensis TaxID=1073253 RepID=A0A840P709_9ACTN|nr:hypothetical protein [Thermocatellispora tengchongensis]MBB5133641.1 hypothetical protein [Thermocatellispora tengchongensis]
MESAHDSIRPKLKPDVYWVPHPDGAVFVHSSAHLTVRGKSALALMDRLAPHLDGAVTLGELVTGLPDGKREMVTTLVSSLLTAGLIKDVSGDEPHGLTAAELELYAAEIAYIDYYLDSAARRFEVYRNTPIACVGSGLTLTALAHACLAAGARDVRVLVTGESPTSAERLDDYARLAAERDPAQRLTHGPLSGSLAAAIGDAGVVLHVSDRPMAARAAELDRICQERGLPLVQGVMAGDEAWTGPVSGSTGMLWTAAWLRRAANLGLHPDPFTGTSSDGTGGDGAGTDGTGAEGAEPSPFLAGPTAAIVANRVSFTAFRHITGIADADPHSADPAKAGRAAVSVVNLETLNTGEYRFHPHPAAQRAASESADAFAERYRAFLAATRLDDETFSARAASCFDPRLGLFAEMDEGELQQLPLYAARARVSDPFGHAGTGDGRERPQVTGAGVTQAQARHETGIAALAAYAALAVDRRRLTSDGQAYAHNLVLEKDEPVPAELLYPVLRAEPGPFRVPVGLVAGPDAGTALADGLLAHIVALTAAAAVTSGTPFPRVDLDAAALPDTPARYLEMLRVARVPLTAYDVTGPLGVPVYALCVEDRTIAYAAAPRLAAGLARVLLDYQGVPTHLDGDAPALPEPLRGTDTAAWREAPEPDWRALTRTLHEHGYQAHAAPAGHDPVIARVLPTLVQVTVHG